MGRKFRSTEISGNVNVDTRQHGQHMHANMFCVNCHGFKKHYPDCTKPEAYMIPATAEVPRKNANPRIWEIFKKQFVYSKPVGFWIQYDGSWYSKSQLKNLRK